MRFAETVVRKYKKYSVGESINLKIVDNHKLPWDIISLRLKSCQMEYLSTGIGFMYEMAGLWNITTIM